jgi:hypothetical protein
MIDGNAYLYQFHFAPARRRLFAFQENKLFLTKGTRSLKQESVLHK